MSIIRAPRPDSNWYALDKRISEDSRLSWAARGLLIFLLGKPDHWEVSVKHLINQTANAIGKASGRDAVRAILKELEQAGYLKADMSRDEGGAFAGMAYTVRELPDEQYRATAPETDFPAPVKSQPANPAPADPHQVKTERKQHIDVEEKTDLEHSPAPAVADEGARGELVVIEAPGGKRYEIPAELRYPGPGAKTYKTWCNYAICYQRRYGCWPVWNATVAGQVAKFIERVGVESAPKVAAFFVGLNDSYLLKVAHSVKALLGNAEAYHTQYQTGRGMTDTRARQIDQTQANFDAASEALALLDQRRAAHEPA